MKIPRWYQRRCTTKLIKAIFSSTNCHPIGAVPTGAGKSLILCMVIDKYLSELIEKDVLVLSHRKEILKQDFNALEEYFAEGMIGMYSAGVGTKEKRKVTVAGIQSVWKKPELFHKVGLVIIDEAHLVNTNEDGMYREFLGYLDANYAGLTATHYRLGQGYIHEGENSLFNTLAYDLTSTENYEKLVRQGYLSKMFPRQTKLKLDIKNVRVRGGDFRSEDLSKNIDRDAVTDIACNETLITINKLSLKKTLIFAIDIKHAENIKEKMNELGITTGIVHSKMESSREIVIEMFKDGHYKVVVNVDILTTGLDIPDIDHIVLLRPTKSPSLHVQMLGRGGRVVYKDGYDLLKKKERLKAISKSTKSFCIVSDFAGNVARLGPINHVSVSPAKKSTGDGSGEGITKVCPDCNTINAAAKKFCDCCGHEFEFKQNLKMESDDKEIIKEKSESTKAVEKEQKKIKEENRSPLKDGVWFDVTHISYQMHSKKGKTSSLRVIYKCGFRIFSEYICIDHGGWARHKAKQWLKERFPENEPKPENLRELFAAQEKLEIPRKIFVVQDGRWTKIEDFLF